MTQIITSLQNQLVKDIQRLLEKGRERRRQELLVAEGRREVSLALGNGYKAQALLICPDIYTPDNSYPIAMDQLDADNIYNVSTGVYNKLAYRNNAEGILLVAQTQAHTLEGLKVGPDPLILVLEQVEKPGNLGAILRTCDAASVDAVIICDPATDLYNPNIIRSSLGCLFTQQIASATLPQVTHWLKKQHITTYAAAPDAPATYDQHEYTHGVAFVFGSESMGLSQDILNALDHQISIPMAGTIDSLNVSVSAAIIIFEALRQRRNTK